MPSIKLEFDFVTPGLNSKDGLIRTNQFQQKELKEMCYNAILCTEFKRFKCPVEIIYERQTTGKPMDYDNLVSSGKFWLDGLKKAGVIQDDSPEIIGTPKYINLQGQSKTIITIKKREPVS